MVNVTTRLRKAVRLTERSFVGLIGGLMCRRRIGSNAYDMRRFFTYFHDYSKGSLDLLWR
jgi:hypothetical protein